MRLPMTSIPMLISLFFFNFYMLRKKWAANYLIVLGLYVYVSVKIHPQTPLVMCLQKLCLHTNKRRQDS